MQLPLVWDEAKRKINLAKHGLDFAGATWVLASRYRLDVVSGRQGEERMQSFAYVFGRLAVPTVVHLEREEATRVISFRTASKVESEIYYDWLSKEAN